MILDYYKNLSTFQKVKYITIVLYFLMNLIFLITSFNMSVDNLKFMIKMGKYSDYIRYYAIATMFLFFTIIYLYYREIRGIKAKNELADNEIVKLKSKLYDKGNAEANTEDDKK